MKSPDGVLRNSEDITLGFPSHFCRYPVLFHPLYPSIPVLIIRESSHVTLPHESTLPSTAILGPTVSLFGLPVQITRALTSLEFHSPV